MTSRSDSTRVDDITEVQLRRAYERAHGVADKTGEALLADLETRLDAFVLGPGSPARSTSRASWSRTGTSP